MSGADEGTSRLKLSDPNGTAAKGNTALGVPSLEEQIAERAQLAENKRRIRELEKNNAELKEVLEKGLKKAIPSKSGGGGKTRHIAHAEGWKAVCTAPDFCKVGNAVVAFNSFATLDQKHTASSDVKARGTAVYRKGDVVKNVQADAGQHIVSGTSQSSGHVKILDGHDTVKVNGVAVARHDSRCLINCDASGVGGAQGQLVTEQKPASGGGAIAQNPQALPGERTSKKLQDLKKARELVSKGMANLDALDKYVNFQESHKVLDGLIGQISGKSGTAADYAAQATRAVLGFGKDVVMGAVQLAYEGVKAVPKLEELTHTQNGQVLAQLDAQILAENIKLGNITPGTIGQGALNIAKAIVQPVTDPWAKGQYVEAVTRGVAEVGTLGLGWLKGTKTAQSAKAVEVTRTAEGSGAAAAIRVSENGKVAKIAGAVRAPDGTATIANDGTHVKAPKATPRQIDSLALADKAKITRMSDEAALAEKNAKLARTAGDEERAAQFDAIADERIKQAREVLQPYVRDGDVQGVLDRLDVSSGKDGAHFWSGWKDGALESADALAGKSGGVSLESTSGGRVVNGWDAINKSKNPAIRDGFWSGLSEKYASGAEGRITIVHSDAAWLEGGGNIWKSVELPQIIEHGGVTDALFLDLNGNVRMTLSFDELKLYKADYQPNYK